MSGRPRKTLEDPTVYASPEAMGIRGAAPPARPALGPEKHWQADGDASPESWPEMRVDSQTAGEVGGVTVGVVLNDIYRVTRFIAEGGMGVVFEGVNVEYDSEKVAIKVIRPALASDPKVLALFEREARVLLSIRHDAIVAYRNLAKEPKLRVRYIVMEFVDGLRLSDVVTTLEPTTADLIGFLHRMASGLDAAHRKGAVHRDLSLDNVMLPDGQLDQAKIIDFGIAKELNQQKSNIIGDGFAGKWGYVAPEQLGAFGGEIGRWTDVYSLGLIVLALASRSNVDMGITAFDALEKRREVPDLSSVPETLKSVLTEMLKPNPADRLRSMADIVKRLDEIDAHTPSSSANLDVAGLGLDATPPTVPSAPEVADSSDHANPRRATGGKRLVAAITVAGLVAGVSALAFFGVKHPPARDSLAPQQSQGAPDHVVSSDCSWLNIAAGAENGSTLVSGISANPSSALANIQAASKGKAKIDFGKVEPVAGSAAFCKALNVFNATRELTGSALPRLSTVQSEYEIQPQPGPATTPLAKPVIQVAVGDPKLDFVVLGFGLDGSLTPTGLSRATAPQVCGQANAGVSPQGVCSLTLSTSVKQAWAGVVLLVGKGPFPVQLLTLPVDQRPADWARNIQESARNQGWQADLTWYRVVERPNVAPPTEVIPPHGPVRPPPPPPSTDTTPETHDVHIYT